MYLDDHLFETKCRFALHVNLRPSIPGNTRDLMHLAPLSAMTIPSLRRPGCTLAQTRQPRGDLWLVHLIRGSQETGQDNAATMRYLAELMFHDIQPRG